MWIPSDGIHTKIRIAKELKNPKKREYALSVSNQFYFVTSKGLMKKDEVPDECGLMEVTMNENAYAIKTIKKAPHRPVEPPSWWFVASIARRVGEKERKILDDGQS